MKPLLILLILMIVGASSAVSQNILQLAEGIDSPSATIDQLAWLEGHWITDALGGTAEEYWSAPAAGTMMGMFRLFADDTIRFYELFTITEEDGSLLLRIKHFHRDLKGWEEKDETADFPLVKLENHAVWFSGLTMKMEDENSLTVYVLSQRENGSQEELVFPYLRVNQDNP